MHFLGFRADGVGLRVLTFWGLGLKVKGLELRV